MNDSNSGVVSVRIYDREYSLRTSGNPDRLLSLSALIDRRMREIAASSGTADTLKVAILAALSLADEVSKTADELRKMDETVSRRSLECVSMLDRFLH